MQKPKQKRDYSNYHSKQAQMKKRVKLQSMSHNLRNKINGLLNEAEAQEKLDHLMLNQQLNPNTNNDLPIIVPKVNPNLINSPKEEIIQEKNEDANSNYVNKDRLNLKNIEKNLKRGKKR